MPRRGSCARRTTVPLMIMSTVPSVRPWLMSVSFAERRRGKTLMSNLPLLRFLIFSAAHRFGVIGLAGLVDVRPLELLLREGAGPPGEHGGGDQAFQDAAVHARCLPLGWLSWSSRRDRHQLDLGAAAAVGGRSKASWARARSAAAGQQRPHVDAPRADSRTAQSKACAARKAPTQIELARHDAVGREQALGRQRADLHDAPAAPRRRGGRWRTRSAGCRRYLDGDVRRCRRAGCVDHGRCGSTRSAPTCAAISRPLRRCRTRSPRPRRPNIWRSRSCSRSCRRR